MLKRKNKMKKETKTTKQDQATNIFEKLKDSFLGERGVTEGKMFGSPNLKVKGKVFVFPWKGDLVFKLSEQRVQELIKAKKGKYFDPGHGRTSKTWIAVHTDGKENWKKLTQESKEFVIVSK